MCVCVLCVCVAPDTPFWHHRIHSPLPVNTHSSLRKTTKEGVSGSCCAGRNPLKPKTWFFLERGRARRMLRECYANAMETDPPWRRRAGTWRAPAVASLAFSCGFTCVFVSVCVMLCVHLSLHVYVSVLLPESAVRTTERTSLRRAPRGRK